MPRGHGGLRDSPGVFSRGGRLDAVWLVASEVRLIERDKIAKRMGEHVGNGASVVDLDATNPVFVDKALPHLRCDWCLGKNSHAAFDSPEPSRSLLKREVEAAAVARRARADVPELRVLLEASKDGRPLADKGPNGRAYFGVEWVGAV